MEIGGSNLKVTRASIGFTQAAGLEMGVNAMSMFAGTTSNDFEEGRVLCLLNMVTAEELIDNDEYDGNYHPFSPSWHPSLIAPSIQSVYTILLLHSQIYRRNQRRHRRGMHKVRRRARDQNPPPLRRQPSKRRRRQDLRQVRHPRLCDQGVEGACWAEVCRSDGRHHLF